MQWKQLLRAQILHLEAEQPPSARTHIPLPPHSGPRKRHIQSYWERQVPGRAAKMHQNKIFLLLSQHLHQHFSSLPPQQSLEMLILLPGSSTQAHPAGMGQLASGGGRSSLGMGRSSAELCGSLSRGRDAPPPAALSESCPAATAPITPPDATYGADVVSPHSIDWSHFLSVWDAAPGPTLQNPLSAAPLPWRAL